MSARLDEAVRALTSATNEWTVPTHNGDHVLGAIRALEAAVRDVNLVSRVQQLDDLTSEASLAVLEMVGDVDDAVCAVASKVTTHLSVDPTTIAGDAFSAIAGVQFAVERIAAIVTTWHEAISRIRDSLLPPDPPATPARIAELMDRWQASGETEDEAALLRAEMLAGRIHRKRMAGAAHAGSEAARVALRSEAPRADGRIDSWGHSFVHYGDEAVCRVGVALAIVADRCRSYSGYKQAPSKPLARGRAAVERYIVAPSADTEATARRVTRGGHGALGSLHDTLPWGTLHPRSTFGGMSNFVKNLGRPELKSDPDAFVRAVIAEELVPWFLGRYDPISYRLASRTG